MRLAEDTLAARGLEEPRNFQELLIESVGSVFFLCFMSHRSHLLFLHGVEVYHIRTYTHM